ncbi:MAG: hypothetical protein EHM19_09070 [Candidatus Latescibacterota bacterium]|nr:MAG: hypothetical protein EHM19_09070 [Candidatus Latescibacterota bacterium]
MRRLAFATFAFAFALAFALLPGCGGGDDDNPSGPNGNDTLATEQVLQEIENVLGSVQSSYQGCDAVYVVSGLLNEETSGENTPEILFLASVIDSASRNEGDLSPFYGSWQDTTPLQPLDAPARVDDEPASAVAVLLVGVDTLGALVTGDITLNEFFADQETGEIRVEAAVHADGGPDSLWFRVDGELASDLSTADVELWLRACAAGFYAHAELSTGENASNATISGWYEYPGDPKLWFEIAGSGDASDIEGSVSGTIHLWTTDDPEFDLVLNLVNDPDTCLTGEIEIEGHKEADIYMVDCDDDSAAALYIVIDGQTFDGEELLGEIFGILVSLDPNDVPGTLDLMSSKRVVPPILWPMGKGHAEALERYRK